jgi:hypothetical protein
MANQDKKELWVGWTHDAMSRYVMPDDIDDVDDLVEDMVAAATKYADAMVDEFEERFSGGTRRNRKKKKDDDDDDPDLDD